jgi:hypothetical protein
MMMSVNFVYGPQFISEMFARGDDRLKKLFDIAVKVWSNVVSHSPYSYVIPCSLLHKPAEESEKATRHQSEPWRL